MVWCFLLKYLYCSSFSMMWKLEFSIWNHLKRMNYVTPMLMLIVVLSWYSIIVMHWPFTELLSILLMYFFLHRKSSWDLFELLSFLFALWKIHKGSFHFIKSAFLYSKVKRKRRTFIGVRRIRSRPRIWRLGQTV